MATFGIAPSIVFHCDNDDGTPLVGGKVYTYLSGTDTPYGTKVSADGDDNTNPVILNSRGEARIWLDPTVAYTFVVNDSEDNPVIPAVDNITVNDPNGINAAALDTIADLRAYEGTATLFYIRGYFEAGDGCGGWFQWEPELSVPNDGVINFSPNSAPVMGRFVRNWDGATLSIRYAGDDGTGSHSGEALTRMAAYVASYGGTVYYAPGVYEYDVADYTIEFPIVASDGANIKVTDGGTLRFSQKVSGNPFVGEYLFKQSTGFEGGIDLSEAKGTLAYPEWFGAIGDDSTDDTDAFDRLFDAAPKVMEFPSVTGYLVDVTNPFPIPYSGWTVNVVGEVATNSTTVMAVGVHVQGVGRFGSGLTVGTESSNASTTLNGTFSISQTGSQGEAELRGNSYVCDYNSMGAHVVIAEENGGIGALSFFGVSSVARQSITETAAISAVTEIQDILIAYGLATDDR